MTSVSTGSSGFDRVSKVACLLLYQVDGRVWILRLSDEHLFETWTVPRKCAGEDSILLWGTFAWTSMGRVVLTEGTMKAVYLVKIPKVVKHAVKHVVIMISIFSRPIYICF